MSYQSPFFGRDATLEYFGVESSDTFLDAPCVWERVQGFAHDDQTAFAFWQWIDTNLTGRECYYSAFVREIPDENTRPQVEAVGVLAQPKRVRRKGSRAKGVVQQMELAA